MNSDGHHNVPHHIIEDLDKVQARHDLIVDMA